VAEPSPFEPLGDFVDGAFRIPECPVDEIRLQDPGDLDAVRGAFPVGFDSVDAAVEAARRAWPAWRDASAEDRAGLLRRFALEIERDKEELARLIALEVGKPLWEARTEVAAMQAKIPITLGEGLEQIAERRIGMEAGQAGRLRARPRGALAVLGPFNFPGHLVHGHVVPALATGNTVVVKPSDKAPATGQRYAEIARRTGFPPGVFNLVQGKADVGSRLAAHADLDGVLFTGSYAAGRMILEATLDQPWKLVALEMGGKNGVLVCDDADVRAAVHAIAFGACVTTGQRCSATSRLIVDRKIEGRVLEGLVHLMGSLTIGHATDDDVFMGPLVSSEARKRHAEVMDLARAEHAERVLAGGPCEGPRRGWYVRPSIHHATGVRRGSRYQGEEHFVPDLCVIGVDSFEEGLAALNATDYGLVGSIFTAQKPRYEQAVRESRLGLLNWNTSTVGASSRLPFGGLRKSGNDRPAGSASVFYCTYPMASLEVEAPATAPLARHPGFPWPR
jgi:succinylglutamic semialdehyde dehydrogenase